VAAPKPIGQGIGIRDYCCVHAALAMREGRLRANQLVKRNPETDLHRLRTPPIALYFER